MINQKHWESFISQLGHTGGCTTMGTGEGDYRATMGKISL